MTNTEILTPLYEQELLGHTFTVYGTWENPLFLSKQVAEWIDYSYESRKKGIRKISQMMKMVDEDEKLKAVYNVTPTTNNVATTTRKTQETWFLNESGVYEILMQSRKPIAKSFKKQVKAILKEIRKTGSYNAQPKTQLEMLRELIDREEKKERLQLQQY